MGKASETGTISPEQVDDLIEAVGELKDELRVLRESIDELRTELEWAMRNGWSPSSVWRHITSFPADPALSDREWADQVNRLTPEDLPPEKPGAQDSGDDAKQSQEGPCEQRGLF